MDSGRRAAEKTDLPEQRLSRIAASPISFPASPDRSSACRNAEPWLENHKERKGGLTMKKGSQKLKMGKKLKKTEDERDVEGKVVQKK